jgi:hypothetical protein
MRRLIASKPATTWPPPCPLTDTTLAAAFQAHSTPIIRDYCFAQRYEGELVRNWTEAYVDGFCADYLAGRVKRKPTGTSYRPGLAHEDLNKLFPAWLTASLKQALKTFDRKMKGFTTDEGTLIGIEARTSTPLRITRNEQFQSVSMKGLYPGGEGAGYAGGIVSSGIDGLRIAEQICAELST